MELRFLGTGAAEGMPGLFCACACCCAARTEQGPNRRYRQAALLDGVVLLDFPPDVYASSDYGAKLTAVRHVLITSREQLHCEALRYAVPPHRLSEPMQLHVYGNDEVIDAVQASYPLPAEVLALHRLQAGTAVTFEGYTITPLPARNGGGLVFLIEKDSVVLLYAPDTGFLPEATWDALCGATLDGAVLDCYNLTLPETPHHMNIEDTVTVLRRLYAQHSTTEATQFIVTHFSHTSGLNHFEIEERVRMYGFRAAYDTMTVTLGR